MSHPALAGLRDVPWKSLHHAYGPAEDVPSLLEELAGSREEREHALHELYGNIWHQGTVYEATAHAVPFLARMAAADSPSDRDELLMLLADIAMGSSYLDVHRDLVRGELTEQERREMAVELAHVQAARNAVASHLPELVGCVMSDPSPAGLALIARFAFAYPDEKELFTEPLQWMWQNEHDSRVRSALALALLRREEPVEYADDVLSDLCSDLRLNPGSNE